MNAVTFGEQSTTCVGSAAAALGALYVGLSQFTRDDKLYWWRRSVAFAEASCSPSGRMAGAAAALDIGMELDDPVHRLLKPDKPDASESAADWYQKSIELGRDPVGRQYARQAKSLLDELEAW